jgi:hypothetical protein
MRDLEQRVEHLEDAMGRIERTLYGNGDPGIKEQIAAIATSAGDLIKRFDEFRREVLKQQEAMWKRISGRPSWAVSIVITVMSSLLVGVVVAYLGR